MEGVDKNPIAEVGSEEEVVIVSGVSQLSVAWSGTCHIYFPRQTARILQETQYHWSLCGILVLHSDTFTELWTSFWTCIYTILSNSITQEWSDQCPVEWIHVVWCPLITELPCTVWGYHQFVHLIKTVTTASLWLSELKIDTVLFHFRTFDLS